MRSVSVTSAGAYSDASAINGALENLDSAIEQFDGGAETGSSNCSSDLTVYRKPPSTNVQIVVHEPPDAGDSAAAAAVDDDNGGIGGGGGAIISTMCCDVSAAGCKKDSGYGSQGVLKIDQVREWHTVLCHTLRFFL